MFDTSQRVPSDHHSIASDAGLRPPVSLYRAITVAQSRHACSHTELAAYAFILALNKSQNAFPQVLTVYADRSSFPANTSPAMSSPSPPFSSSPSNNSAPSDESTEFDPAELLSDLSELPFADEPHSDTASSEYNPALDLFYPDAPHTLLVEVTRHRTVDNPEELREQMEAEVRSIGEGVVGICWTTVVADRLIGSYFEECVGLPVPGEKLLENRALAAAHSDEQGSADEEGLDQALTSEPTSASTKPEGSAAEASAPIDDQRSVTFTFELKGLSIVVGYLLGRKLAEWGRDELSDGLNDWSNTACVVYEDDDEGSNEEGKP